MVKFSANQSTLVMIDLQQRLMPAIKHGNDVLKQCIRIAKIAKLLKIPTIGTEQSPHSIGHNLPEITQFCQATVVKDHFSACQDGLIKAIPKDRTQIILAGCETHVCVMQTALDLLCNQYDVAVLVDAVGSRRLLDKDTALQRLCSSGAILLTVEMLAFEWLDNANNSHFKEALKIIKE